MNRLAWMMIGWILCAVPTCVADPSGTQPATTRSAEQFPQGSWSLTLGGAYAHTFTGSEARLENGTLGLGYYFLDHVSLNAEFSAFSVQQPGPDSVISEFDLLIRHHILVIDRFSLLLDVGGGLSYATEPTPYYGTYFNFFPESGIGATWRLNDNVYLLGGARWIHFSNAALKGPEHNPSINALQGYVGLLFNF